MDPGYYEDLAGRPYGLLIGLGDRIEGGQAQLLHHFIDMGEYGLVLEEIAGALARYKIAITDQERGDMLMLNPPDENGGIVPHVLRFCPPRQPDQILPARPAALMPHGTVNSLA